MKTSISRSLFNQFPRRVMSTSVAKPPGPELDVGKKGFGVEDKYKKDKYINPLLTPPPRSPRAPEDFRHPEKLGHWVSAGWDWTNPKVDRYMMHEFFFCFVTVGVITLWLWGYGPDYKLRDWAKREAYFRTHKREALGLPLIDRNVVDPARIVLPSEEELGDFDVHF